jgi:hypothetical protein
MEWGTCMGTGRCRAATSHMQPYMNLRVAPLVALAASSPATLMMLGKWVPNHRFTMSGAGSRNPTSKWLGGGGGRKAGGPLGGLRRAQWTARHQTALEPSTISGRFASMATGPMRSCAWVTIWVLTPCTHTHARPQALTHDTRSVQPHARTHTPADTSTRTRQHGAHHDWMTWMTLMVGMSQLGPCHPLLHTPAHAHTHTRTHTCPHTPTCVHMHERGRHVATSTCHAPAAPHPPLPPHPLPHTQRKATPAPPRMTGLTCTLDALAIGASVRRLATHGERAVHCLGRVEAAVRVLALRLWATAHHTGQ